MWHEDRFRPLINAIVNLGLNLILVRFIGLYGVILSTVIACLFVGMPWLLHNLFTVMFERKYMMIYLKKVFTYTSVNSLIAIFLVVVCNKISFDAPLVEFFIKGLVCATLSNIIYYLIFHKTIEFSQCKDLLNQLTRNKFRRILEHI